MKRMILVLAALLLLAGAVSYAGIPTTRHAAAAGVMEGDAHSARRAPAPKADEQMAAGIEPFAGLPEPSSIVLLGTALLITSNIVRRRLLRPAKGLHNRSTL